MPKLIHSSPTSAYVIYGWSPQWQYRIGQILPCGLCYSISTRTGGFLRWTPCQELSMFCPYSKSISSIHSSEQAQLTLLIYATVKGEIIFLFVFLFCIYQDQSIITIFLRNRFEPRKLECLAILMHRDNKDNIIFKAYFLKYREISENFHKALDLIDRRQM